MSKQVLLTVPDDIYDQAERLATNRQQDVPELLLETIIHSFSAFPVDARREAMSREVDAYEALHSKLVKTHGGQYVAITEGQLVDADSDPVALLTRVRQNFPNQAVLRRKVAAQPVVELRSRRPRFQSIR
ncbi:MAG: hypothetical protein AAF614_35650 [Chloroflexota bacterium]